VRNEHEPFARDCACCAAVQKKLTDRFAEGISPVARQHEIYLRLANHHVGGGYFSEGQSITLFFFFVSGVVPLSARDTKMLTFRSTGRRGPPSANFGPHPTNRGFRLINIQALWSSISGLKFPEFNSALWQRDKNKFQKRWIGRKDLV
jgi:hypothetical protein